jgi:hypothetical protein
MKRVISEVGSHIPLNGGVYSAMMLASTKSLAAVAACCSILDYVATGKISSFYLCFLHFHLIFGAAVVSGASATSYFYGEFGLINVYWTTLGVLLLFCLLAMLVSCLIYSP